VVGCSADVTQSLRACDAQFLAHVANIQADWDGAAAGLSGVLALAEPRWAAAMAADNRRVAQAQQRSRGALSTGGAKPGWERAPTALLGEFSAATTNGTTVVNLYAQRGVREPVELHHMRSALTRFVRHHKPQAIYSTLTQLGCRAGDGSTPAANQRSRRYLEPLNWEHQVRPMLEDIAKRYRCRFYIWEQAPVLAAKRKGQQQTKRLQQPLSRRPRGTAEETLAQRKANWSKGQWRKPTEAKQPPTPEDAQRQPSRNKKGKSQRKSRGSSERKSKVAVDPGNVARSAASFSVVENAAGETMTTVTGDAAARAPALQHALAEGIAAQIRARLGQSAATGGVSMSSRDGAESAQLLEALAVKAIRSEVAAVISQPNPSIPNPGSSDQVPAQPTVATSKPSAVSKARDEALAAALDADETPAGFDNRMRG
jgi:hypothetical protein